MKEGKKVNNKIVGFAIVLVVMLGFYYELSLGEMALSVIMLLIGVGFAYSRLAPRTTLGWIVYTVACFTVTPILAILISLFGKFLYSLVMKIDHWRGYPY